MDPINYGASYQDPMDAFKGAFQVGGAILGQQTARDAAEAARDAAEAARLKAEAEAKAQAERDALLKSLQRPEATYEDYMKASMILPKDKAEAIQKAATAMKTEERTAALTDSSQVYSAYRGGRTDGAVSLNRKQGEAERAAGNTQGADYAETLAQMAEKSPEGAKAVENLVGYQLAALPGGKDAFDAIGKLETERRTAEEFPALMAQKAQELAKATSEAEKLAIEAKYKELRETAEIAKLNAETAKLDAEAFKLKLEGERPDGTKIDESARKLMNESVTAAMNADLVAAQSDNLSKAFDAQRPAAGWGAKGMEYLKKALGGEDKFTALKQEYVKLRNTEALRNLPPGPASDKDIDIALKAFPDDNSNPELIASFLRGMAKLQRYTSAVNKAKAEWVNMNGSLGPAQMEFTAGGKPVKKGMPFWDFTKSIEIPNVAGGSAAPAAVSVDY